MKRKKEFDGRQYAAQPIDLLKSPVWDVLSNTARKIIARIEIELANHGGKDNGKLPVTYEQFRQYGISRRLVARSIREAEALGIISCKHGRGGNADLRQPSLFGLTYRRTDNAPATDDWRRITTKSEAKKTAAAARDFRAHLFPNPHPLSGPENLNFRTH